MHYNAILTLLLSCLPFLASARRGSWTPPKVTHPDPATDWATKHMAVEHEVSNFDAGAFFSLHDFDTSGGWTPDEVRRMYGLESEESKHVSVEDREKVTREVFKLYDVNKNGVIERDEWMKKNNEEGVRLPDFGFGPGHHFDDEEEYEVHHFQKYHSGPDVREEELTHPEDIAHFAKHDKEDQEIERFEILNKQSIVEENIPAMFRKNN